MRFVVRLLGMLVGIFVSLPMPWRARVWIASLLEAILAMLLKIAPSIYRFIISENQRFGMGKQQDGEMESIMGLELVLRELEGRATRPEEVKEVLRKARAEGVSNVELPRYIATSIFGREEANKLLDRIVAF